MTSRICSALLTWIMMNLAHAQWPMSNDPAFDPSVDSPVYAAGAGPTILLDGAHHNFFVQWDFIDPFARLAQADGYRTVVGKEKFSPGYIADPEHYDRKLGREGWVVFSRENGLLNTEHPIANGRVAAFGDSNGFTAMNFEEEDGSVMSLGMNTAHHDWKQMVLNVLHWLSKDLS